VTILLITLGAPTSPINGKKSHKKGTLGELITLHSRLRMGQEKVISGRQQWDGLMKKVMIQ
jgi:hypothetical protein